MLNGIGGNTIAEAKEKLSYAEAREWFEYIRMRGSLNPSRHVERGFALLAHLTCVAEKIKINGRVPPMKDFMPHRVEQPMSLEQAMSEWV